MFWGILCTTTADWKESIANTPGVCEITYNMKIPKVGQIKNLHLKEISVIKKSSFTPGLG